jgi:predicted cobalt transporter CbtA
MLVGVLAGTLCFAFLKLAGEPSVERAIAFEIAMGEAKHKAAADDAMSKGVPVSHEHAKPELVSREVQAGIGLFTGVTVYGAAFGGLFALAFALAIGRMAPFGPRATSTLLAALAFTALYLIPCLKYPANPPSIGDPDTIGMRTTAYFAMIAISVAAMIGAGMLRARLRGQLGEWNSTLAAGAAYLIIMSSVSFAMPSINEVPDEFPAVVLWQFRLASMGAQLVMWATIGLVFGALTERVAPRRNGSQIKAAPF